eukprot:5908934-Pleurochrysis_carterae.AAC.3
MIFRPGGGNAAPYLPSTFSSQLVLASKFEQQIAAVTSQPTSHATPPPPPSPPPLSPMSEWRLRVHFTGTGLRRDMYLPSRFPRAPDAAHTILRPRLATSRHSPDARGDDGGGNGHR